MGNRARILILDGMWNKSLAAVRSLGSKGLHVTAGEETRLATALFSRYCTKRFIYPSPAGHQERFIEHLERELREGNYNVIMPTEWGTQRLLTESVTRQRLERYTRIPYANAFLAERVNDKAFVMNHAMGRGISIPNTYFPSGSEHLIKIAQNLAYPVLIKPRSSSGSRGIARAGNKEELLVSYKKVHQKYPFPLVQERIPPGGGAYGVGVLLNFQSHVRASFVYRRIREYPVSGGPSTLRESARNDLVREIAESLLQSLQWIGVAHVEFKVDPRNGQPKLLEVNPRFWGSLSLAIESGMDFPFLLYRMAMEGDIETVRDYKVGVRCRWLIPGDMLHFIMNPQRFKLRPHFFDFSMKDDILSREDPLPTLGRALSLFSLLFHGEMRALLRR